MSVIKDAYSCPLMLAMDLVGGKWKMVIVGYLQNGKLRFSQLKRLMPGITQKMLTDQLRELERMGIITRTVYPVVPPKVEYNLTETGEALIPALNLLCEWSAAYAKNHGIGSVPTCIKSGCHTSIYP